MRRACRRTREQGGTELLEVRRELTNHTPRQFARHWTQRSTVHTAGQSSRHVNPGGVDDFRHFSWCFFLFLKFIKIKAAYPHYLWVEQQANVNWNFGVFIDWWVNFSLNCELLIKKYFRWVLYFTGDLSQQIDQATMFFKKIDARKQTTKRISQIMCFRYLTEYLRL